MLSRYRNRPRRSPANLAHPFGRGSRWGRRGLVAVATATVLLLCQGVRPVLGGGEYPSCAPKILVLRGVFEVFSLGMNDLAQKLRCRGYDAEVTSWTLALPQIECSDPRPLVIVGHSLGGRMCAWSARKLKSCGQRVPLLIVVDANLMQPIPPNVDKCLNLYVTNKLGVFHGSPVYPESCCTEIVNWDVSQGQPSMFVGGVNHFDIDSTDWVHQIIIDEIDAMFGPPASPTFEFGERGPRPRLAATATGRQRVTLAPVAPHRPDGLGAPSSAVVAGAAPGWSAPPVAPPGQAGDDVRWQTPRERDPAGHATPTSSADLAGRPSTGLRLRFASPLDSSLRVADQRMPTN